MAGNITKLKDSSYNQTINNPDVVLVNLSKSNFYATRMEMTANIGNPLGANDLRLIRFITDPKVNIKQSLFLLDTFIFHRNLKLIHPNYDPSLWKNKGSFAYVETLDGFFNVYLDENNKQRLYDANHDIITTYSEHDFRLKRPNNEWKPLSFYDLRNRLLKQIEFLEVYARSKSTPRRYAKLMREYISKLNGYLISEKNKITTFDKVKPAKPAIAAKKHYLPLQVDNLFKPMEWTNAISLDFDVLNKLKDDDLLSNLVSHDTLEKNNLIRKLESKQMEPPMPLVLSKKQERINNRANKITQKNKNKVISLAPKHKSEAQKHKSDDRKHEADARMLPHTVSISSKIGHAFAQFFSMKKIRSHYKNKEKGFVYRKKLIFSNKIKSNAEPTVTAEPTATPVKIHQ